MSTKLHHGFRVPQLVTLVDVQLWWRKLSDQLELVREAAIRKLLTEETLLYFDCDALGIPREKPECTPRFAALMHISDKIEAAIHSATRSPGYDFEFSVALLPSAHGTLALVFTECSELFDAFGKSELVAPYPYWNSHDRPDDLTDAEWDERGATWGAALGRGVPCLSGPCVELSHASGYGADLREIPVRDVEKLAAHFAHAFVRDEYLRSLPKDTFQTQCVGTVLREAETFASEGEGAEKSRTLTAEYAAKLTAQPTIEQLNRQP